MLFSPRELEERLRDIGARRYHRLHPFHQRLHSGQCTKGEVQAWALNRYYYQAMIPIKDASLIARCEDRALRRQWRSRLIDHDGLEEGDGGIERWLKLTEGVGLARDYVTSTRGLRVPSLGAVLSSQVAVLEPRESGRRLDVQVVVEGSVRRAGDRPAQSLPRPPPTAGVRSGSPTSRPRPGRRRCRRPRRAAAPRS